ncbi:MAG: histidine decarboxylase, partial [Xanthomonadales bacterium]|nr:histidine decarboxylase [Xanthomonadales bacterium]
MHPRLEKLIKQLEKATEHSLGYPGSTDFDYQALYPFLAYSLNNIGDPFADITYKLNTYSFERDVVEFYARHTRAPDDAWWGYVTNGGTEGNLYGLYLARELYPDGIVYHSQDTHYSVSKNLHFLGMKNIMIRSQDNGEIDYADLRETLRIRRDVPPIIFANIGTTMTEARDDIGRIKSIFEEFAITKYYIHSDAALSGGYLPFIQHQNHWDFADGAHSISISGHKFIGSPIPCGIVLALKDNVERISRTISYIGGRDTTVTGSRNGFSPLMLWQAIETAGEQGLQQRASKALKTAAFAVECLQQAGVAAWRNENAFTVV